MAGTVTLYACAHMCVSERFTGHVNQKENEAAVTAGQVSLSSDTQYVCLRMCVCKRVLAQGNVCVSLEVPFQVWRA